MLTIFAASAMRLVPNGIYPGAGEPRGDRGPKQFRAIDGNVERFESGG